MEWIVEAECKSDLVDGYGLIGREVVRCKDCIHRFQFYDVWNDIQHNVCELHGTGYLDDWYCADGERKD